MRVVTDDRSTNVLDTQGEVVATNGSHRTESWSRGTEVKAGTSRPTER
jgi:hypothetical protein